MSADIAIKACSTFVAFFALVSMKGIPISSANAFQVLTNQWDQDIVITIMSSLDNNMETREPEQTIFTLAVS